MNLNMKYSVLMTVYCNDNPKYFKEALMSMVNQTCKPDEIVIVKDGPVPESIQRVIDNVINDFEGVIKQVQLIKNVGLGLALNEGIKVCRNELIARMDADDISLLTRCEKQINEFMLFRNLDIVGCTIEEFIDNPNIVSGTRRVPLTNEEIYAYSRRRDPFNHPTVMYRKSKVEEVGCYGDLRKNQDTDLWIKMLSAGAHCKNLSEPLLKFRFNIDTYKKRKNWLNTKLLILIRWKAYMRGFCSLDDFLFVTLAQIGIYILPIKFQKFLYKNFLR